jgi:hypothetical protein
LLILLLVESEDGKEWTVDSALAVSFSPSTSHYDHCMKLRSQLMTCLQQINTLELRLLSSQSFASTGFADSSVLDLIRDGREESLRLRSQLVEAHPDAADELLAIRREQLSTLASMIRFGTTVITQQLSIRINQTDVLNRVISSASAQLKRWQKHQEEYKLSQACLDKYIELQEKLCEAKSTVEDLTRKIKALDQSLRLMRSNNPSYATKKAESELLKRDRETALLQVATVQKQLRNDNNTQLLIHYSGQFPEIAARFPTLNPLHNTLAQTMHKFVDISQDYVKLKELQGSVVALYKDLSNGKG